MGRRKKPLQHMQKLALESLALPDHVSAHRIPAREEEELAALAASLASRGQQEPILVTEGAAPGRWRVIVGHKRVLAARRLGWPALDALILPGRFQLELRVIEALQEGRYEPFALADTLRRLKEQHDWTQAQLGYAIGKTRDFVANILAIAQIHPDVRRYIVATANGHPLTARHLRYVARMPAGEQLAMAKQIIGEQLSTKSLERRMRAEAQRRPRPELIRVRALRRAGTPQAPGSAKEWRRYYRQLNTDLRRVERQEQREIRRAAETMSEAKERRRLIRHEASRKRNALARELREARRHVEPGGAA
jgi:ParB/RepB/Spo0J family partition protein